MGWGVVVEIVLKWLILSHIPVDLCNQVPQNVLNIHFLL